MNKKSFPGAKVLQVNKKLNNNFEESLGSLESLYSIENQDNGKKENYVFGDFIGNIMSKASMRFQFESAMMSMVMIMFGLIISTIYVIGWTDFSLFFKIMTTINGFFGLLFLWSFLLTQFQQYQTYMAIEKLNIVKGG